MKPKLIIDGYNVAHAWHETAAVMRGQGAEEARRLLIAKLAQHAATTATEITVVFDSHFRARGVGDSETIDGIQILYGSKQQSADHLIERLCYEAKHSENTASVIVVTNDRLQRDLVTAMGVGTMNAEALRKEVEASGRERDREIERRSGNARSANRFEAGLDSETWEKLERMRRGE